MLTTAVVDGMAVELCDCNPFCQFSTPQGDSHSSDIALAIEWLAKGR
jgi:hypothetical protein